MKIEARIFELTYIFMFISALVYGLWAGDQIGTTALVLTGGLCMIVGTYFRFVSRRVEMRPEDNPDAEISDGAGELGFFSPGSYWPVGVAAAASVLGLGLAFYQAWLIAIGIAAVLIMVGGLVFEYHTGADED